MLSKPICVLFSASEECWLWKSPTSQQKITRVSQGTTFPEPGLLAVSGMLSHLSVCLFRRKSLPSSDHCLPGLGPVRKCTTHTGSPTSCIQLADIFSPFCETQPPYFNMFVNSKQSGTESELHILSDVSWLSRSLSSAAVFG